MNGCLKRKIEILSEDDLQKTHRYVPAPIRAQPVRMDMGMGSLAALNEYFCKEIFAEKIILQSSELFLNNFNIPLRFF